MQNSNKNGRNQAYFIIAQFQFKGYNL